jgi:hypothetical protein
LKRVQQNLGLRTASLTTLHPSDFVEQLMWRWK